MLVLVTVLCVPLCWLGYQLNWIRQRHEALAAQRVIDFGGSASVPAPGMLGMFGERGRVNLVVMGRDGMPTDEDDLKRAQELFPEANVGGLYRSDSPEKSTADAPP
jgi:hypothetical protein